MSFPELDVLKELPGYQAIMKGVLKNLIQILIEQLSMTTGEESVILTASVNDGSLSHLGSKSGKEFLQENEDFKSKFLGFCLQRQHMKKTIVSNTHVESEYSQSHQSSPQNVASLSQIAVKRRAGLSQSSPYFARRQSSTVSSSERQSSILTEEGSLKQSSNDMLDQIKVKEEPSQETDNSDESSKGGVVKQELSEEEVEVTGITYGFPSVTATCSNLTPNSDKVNVEFPAEGGEISLDQKQWFQNPLVETADLGNTLAENDDLKKPGNIKNTGQHSQEYMETPFKNSKLFKCTTCEKAFSRLGDMQRHMKTHTGEKPYECKYCDRRFSRKDNMRTHMVRNHACKFTFS